MLTTTEDVKKRQAKEAADVKTEIANLEKKLNYLDTTYKNTQTHMNAILQRGG